MYEATNNESYFHTSRKYVLCLNLIFWIPIRSWPGMQQRSAPFYNQFPTLHRHDRNETQRFPLRKECFPQNNQDHNSMVLSQHEVSLCMQPQGGYIPGSSGLSRNNNNNSKRFSRHLFSATHLTQTPCRSLL